ncbi:MAG: hypothetical protein AB8F74_14040 [Saprospiraceae bacterium]
MTELTAVTPTSKGKRLAQFGVLFFVLIILPLGTVYYTSGGNDSFKLMIGELHEYGELPDFSFAAHNGQQLTREKLEEKLVVNAFTSLDDKDANLMAAQLKKLHAVFNDKNEVLFLIHSLDAEQDRNKLISFAERNKLTDDEQFYILTGGQEEINKHLKLGFRWPKDFETREKTKQLQMDEVPDGIQTYPYLVIADKKGMIRNYYDYKDNQAMGRLVEHLALLLPSRTDDDPELVRETEK